MTLVERLEQATEGSRELGNEVLRATGWERHAVGSFYGMIYRWLGPAGESYADGKQPNPTTSIDAAVTVVPEGCSWTVGNNEVLVWRDAGIDTIKRVIARKTRTPPLAIVIAALRAREADG